MQKVLIVRLDAIGDFVLWLDSAMKLRRLFPSDRYRITLLGNHLWTSLAERLSFFDEVLSMERPRFLYEPSYRYQLLRKMRMAGFNIVIQPTFSREFLYGDSVVRFCGAKKRIGSEGDLSNIFPFLKRVSDNWYTWLVPASKKPLMELERNAEFLRGLGLGDFRAGIPELPNLGSPTKETDQSKYYVLFPGAGKTEKIWPKEKFRELAERIFHATGWVGVVCGGPEEEHIGEFLSKNGKIPLRNLVGRTSLEELVGVIAKACLLIGNDTSAIHIAAAVSTPSVCILGGGQYGRFLPYRVEKETTGNLPVPFFYKMDCFFCNWRCIFNIQRGDPAPCISKITVDSVWRGVKEILDKNKKGYRL